MSSSCSLLLLRGGRILKKTFSKSRLSPVTLDRVKMGVMLQENKTTYSDEAKIMKTRAAFKIACNIHAHLVSEARFCD